MGINVIGAVLSIILKDKESGVVPIGAVGYGVNHAPDGEVIVGDRGSRFGLAFLAASGVIIRESKKDELGHRFFAGFTGGNEALEFVEEFVSSQLIGIRHLEIGVERIEMTLKFDFGGDILRENRDGPRIRAWPPAGFAHIFAKGLAFVDEGAGAGDAGDFGRSQGGLI